MKEEFNHKERKEHIGKLEARNPKLETIPHDQKAQNFKLPHCGFSNR